jgi:hypothetical protein
MLMSPPDEYVVLSVVCFVWLSVIPLSFSVQIYPFFLIYGNIECI